MVFALFPPHNAVAYAKDPLRTPATPTCSEGKKARAIALGAIFGVLHYYKPPPTSAQERTGRGGLKVKQDAKKSYPAR